MASFQADTSSNPRKALIKKIQDLRHSKVVVYITGDRPFFPPQMISEDVVRPLYDHLLSLGKSENIDLYIYSRGGNVSVPWRIVSMFREFCKKKFSVLVPYKAYSAATLLALGADEIIMGKKAELGPIDPSIYKTSEGEAPKEISVEDVNSYISFLRERANINDQLALAQGFSILASNITPLEIGQVNRQNSHIRLVSRKLITSRKEKTDEDKIASIIETLTEKIYFHGHAIGRIEAKEIGLPVAPFTSNQESGKTEELEEAMWELFLEYERYLKLNEPIDTITELNNNPENELVHIDSTPVGVIESENLVHEISLQYDIQRRRMPIPPDLKVNVNAVIGLPPNLTVEELPQAFQAAIQQQLNEFAQNVEGLVRQQVYRQAPELSPVWRGYGGWWLNVSE